MTTEEIAAHYAAQCLRGQHPDEAPLYHLSRAGRSLVFRLGGPRSDWPAWAQYIHLRHRAVEARAMGVPL